jgi:hypothetical protein
MSNKKTIHFYYENRAACNFRLTPETVALTEKPNYVTCKACRKTHRFKTRSKEYFDHILEEGKKFKSEKDHILARIFRKIFHWGSNENH